jgi:hypothetical protein
MNAVVSLGAAFSAPAAATFQGIDAGDDLSGGITGGYGLIRYRGKVWAIHYRDQEVQLMRQDGDGPMGSIEAVILKANPHLSKTWYENGWDESSSNPPDCASANGVTPDQGVPKKQSPVCATCPRNQWGTAANGGKGKACGDHRRLAVVPAADIQNEAFGGPMLLRCPAASLQDLASFDAKYKQAGYPYFSMVVKIAFDPKESFPKFVFSAVRPLTDSEAQLVMALRNSEQTARVISDSAPAAAPAAVTEQVTFEQAPNPAPAAAVVQQTQLTQPGTGGHTLNVNPGTTAQPAQTTGFGGAAVAAPKPQPVQQAAQAAQVAPQAAQRPSQTMTGFGGAVAAAAPVVAPQPAAKPVEVVAPAATQPVEAFEASLDDKLAALIGTGS